MSLPDPRARQGWTAKDDQLAIFIFGVVPFHEIRRFLPLLHDRTPPDIYNRFLEIMGSPSLQNRLVSATKGNIIYHQSIPWQPSELLSLVQLIQLGGVPTYSDILTTHPHMFHPTRTVSSVTKLANRIRADNPETLDKQLQKYCEWADQIKSKVERHEEEDQKSRSDDDDDADDETIDKRKKPPIVPEKFAPEMDEPYYPPISRKSPKCSVFELHKKIPMVVLEPSLESVRVKVRAKFSPRSIAALYGRNGIEMIAKPKVSLGRASPNTKPDIDLARYRVQAIARIHCEISLRKDLFFYLEVIGRDVVIDGSLFYKGQCIRLSDEAVVDLCGIPFLFFENPKLRAA